MRGPSAIVVALALSIPVAAPAQIPPSNARCRNGLGKGVEKLAKRLLLAQERCRKLRGLGSLPPSFDCNDPSQSPSITTILHAAAKLKTLALRRCAVASAPAALGYVTCPAPCGGPTADYTTVADCLICLTEHWLGDAGTAAYGMPSPLPLPADAIRCQAGIAGGLTTYLIARFRDEEKCQLTDDRAPIGSDCRSIDFTGAQAVALSTAMHELVHCSDTALATLDSYASTLAPEQACIQQLAEFTADRSPRSICWRCPG